MLKKSLFVLLLVCVPIALLAQPGPPDTDVVDTPVDGGLSILAAAGVGYVLKKVTDKKKNRDVLEK